MEGRGFAAAHEAMISRACSSQFLVSLLLLFAVWASPAIAGEKLAQGLRESPSASEDEIDLRAEALPWLDPDPAIVKLRGYLVEKRFYGPPGWGETPKQDAKVGAWLLLLYEPINVRAEAGDRASGDLNVHRVQLAILSDDKVLRKKTSGLLGQEVFVTGKMYRGNTGWYWTGIAMDLQNIALVPRGTRDPECCR